MSAWHPFPVLAFEPRSRIRVFVLTAMGTAVCIAAAFAIDSYSLETRSWRWGSDPINNFVIPLLVAPPFFFFMLNKLRELAEAHHELMVISSTDGLTNLYNRRAFTALVDAHLKRAETSRPVSPALLVIDIDHFKSVNDTFGHEQGDEALKTVADAIRSVVRDTAIGGRLGGEEFCVFLPAGSRDATHEVAERIRQSVGRSSFQPEGVRHTLSVSVGGVHFERLASFSELYRAADQRLYRAKRNGRNRV